MKRLLATLMIIVTLGSLLALPCVIFAGDNVQERVLTLPQDQGTWYLSLFGNPADEKFQELQGWFKSDKGLVKLKGQVRYNEYYPGQLRYQQRYATGMPGLPCVRLQNEKGLVTSEFWAEYIPLSSAALYRGIREDLQDKASWGCLRRRRCPYKQPPAPQPPLPPVVVPEPPVGPPVLDPELDPEPEPEESNLWMLLVVLGALGGGALGFAQEYKAEHLDKPSLRSSKM